MLATAVEQGIITQGEADMFVGAHELVDARMTAMRGSGLSGGMDEMMVSIVAELVASGDLTKEQADNFRSVHERLGEAGLMQ